MKLSTFAVPLSPFSLSPFSLYLSPRLALPYSLPDPSNCFCHFFFLFLVHSIVSSSTHSRPSSIPANNNDDINNTAISDITLWPSSTPIASQPTLRQHRSTALGITTDTTATTPMLYQLSRKVQHQSRIPIRPHLDLGLHDPQPGHDWYP